MTGLECLCCTGQVTNISRYLFKICNVYVLTLGAISIIYS